MCPLLFVGFFVRRDTSASAWVMKKLLASPTHNIFLKPGEAVVSNEPAVVSTVLGACVAVTMFSPSRRIGAICHAMLSDCGERFDDLRYVDPAVYFLCRKMKGRWAVDLAVKLFGGAQLLDVDSYGWRRAANRRRAERGADGDDPFLAVTYGFRAGYRRTAGTKTALLYSGWGCVSPSYGGNK